MIGCGSSERNSGSPDEEFSAPGVATAQSRPTILFLGTSLTAGLGLDPDSAFPALIQEKIDSTGLPYRTVNAGASGETSAGALRRLDWLLRQPFDVLVVETGANDMLQGSNPDSTRANLQAIIARVRRERPGTRIVLAGMRALPNLGPAYVRQFESIYPDLARRDSLVLIPFLLRGVAGDPKLNQQDGVHPNARGERIVAETVWETLAPVLEQRAPAIPAAAGR